MIRDKKLIDAIDPYGRVVLNTDDVIDSMLSGNDVSGVFLENKDDLEQYESSTKEYNTDSMEFKKYIDIKKSVDEYMDEKSNEWLIPKKYRNIDIVSYLIERCKNEQEKERLLIELNEFMQRDQAILIHLMIYLVDIMRENNIVWGVGRGSSVACFVLYLIGINKVNPLDYDIDYKEFFK